MTTNRLPAGITLTDNTDGTTTVNRWGIASNTFRTRAAAESFAARWAL